MNLLLNQRDKRCRLVREHIHREEEKMDLRERETIQEKFLSGEQRDDEFLQNRFVERRISLGVHGEDENRREMFLDKFERESRDTETNDALVDRLELAATRKLSGFVWR